MSRTFIGAIAALAAGALLAAPAATAAEQIDAAITEINALATGQMDQIELDVLDSDYVNMTLDLIDSAPEVALTAAEPVSPTIGDSFAMQKPDGDGIYGFDPGDAFAQRKWTMIALTDVFGTDPPNIGDGGSASIDDVLS